MKLHYAFISQLEALHLTICQRYILVSFVNYRIMGLLSSSYEYL